MAQPSIFNTTAPVTQTQTTAQSTTTETETATTTEAENTTNTEETTESTTETPTQGMVTLKDGTQVSAEDYVSQRLAESNAKYAERESKINEEWSRIRDGALNHAENANNGNQTQTETRTWNVPKVEIADQESFQSDVEKTLVNNHNQLGDTVAEIGSTVTKEVSDLRSELDTKSAELDEKIQKATEEANLLRTQRQIDNIERTKGITEAELNDVYNEFNGTIGDINALAEIVELRKARETASEERTQEANEERREAVSNVSGGATATATGQGDEQPKGRGLEGKDRYNGAAIAAKYRAFN